MEKRLDLYLSAKERHLPYRPGQLYQKIRQEQDKDNKFKERLSFYVEEYIG